MWRFVAGFALGWFLSGWYQRNAGQTFGAGEIGQLQARAKGAFDESARIVEESKRELQSAVQSAGSDGASRPARRRSSTRRPRGQKDEGA